MATQKAMHVLIGQKIEEEERMGDRERVSGSESALLCTTIC